MLVEAFDKLEDHRRNPKKTYGMVQNVEFRLPFMKLLGARQLPVKLFQNHHRLGSHEKMIKILQL